MYPRPLRGLRLSRPYSEKRREALETEIEAYNRLFEEMGLPLKAVFGEMVRDRGTLTIGILFVETC